MIPVGPFLSVAIFVIIWWMCLFVMLPIGVRNLDEAGVEAPGHERGAPAAPNLGRKLVWTTALAAIVWVVTMVIIALDPMNVWRR